MFGKWRINEFIYFVQVNYNCDFSQTMKDSHEIKAYYFDEEYI
jgi:hypothetical protein